MAGTTISLEDQVLEVRGLDDASPSRSYVWIPSIKTIAGGVSTDNNVTALQFNCDTDLSRRWTIRLKL